MGGLDPPIQLARRPPRHRPRMRAIPFPSSNFRAWCPLCASSDVRAHHCYRDFGTVQVVRDYLLLSAQRVYIAMDTRHLLETYAKTHLRGKS